MTRDDDDDDDWNERRDIVMNHETFPFRPEHETNRIEISYQAYIYIVMRWRMRDMLTQFFGLNTRCVCVCSSLEDIEIFAISKL